MSILAKPANLPKVRFDAKGNLIVTRSRAAASRKAQESGEWGEDRVASLRDAAKDRGVCLVTKVPTPTKNVGGGRIVYLTRSTVDGVGFFFANGRVIADEVKTITGTTTFYLHHVADHQRAYLDTVDRSLGLALLTLVVRGADGFTARVFTVRWKYVVGFDAVIVDGGPKRRDRRMTYCPVDHFETDAEHYPFPKSGTRF